jgi:ABC-type lipoprotein export system ATPase subunit
MKDIIINVNNLNKNYITDSGMVVVLNGINLIIQKGEAVSVLGVSGSGKSTLLNILGGIDKASSGVVEVCNQDLNKLTSKSQTLFRAQNIGFVFQFFHLIPTLTVLENVKSALEPIIKKSAEIHKRSLDCLAELGMEAHKDKFPFQLSGGEQQRVSIARAIVKNPAIILADEPTGNLDSDNAINVMEILKDLQNKINATLIIATHDTLISKFVDRTLVINKTMITETT